MFLSGNSNIKQYVNYFKTYCDSRASIGVSAELNKNILAFCQLTRISLDFNLSIKRNDLMVYEQLCRD